MAPKNCLITVVKKIGGNCRKKGEKLGNKKGNLVILTNFDIEPLGPIQNHRYNMYIVLDLIF